jgi:ABC-2 type transport system ATP-binding protein
VIIINKGRLVADDKLANLQQQGASNFVKVTFKESLEAEWLKRLKGVKSVNKLDTYSWQVETTDANEVKKGLLELSLQHNLNIVSLQTEGGSLEDIFRTLTTQNKA